MTYRGPVDHEQKWNDRWGQASAIGEPASILTAHAELLASQVASAATAPRAIDIAGGQGRNALRLAELGYAVRLTDISSVALSRAEREAQQRSLSIDTRQVDWSSLSPDISGSWELVLIVAYLNRPLLAAMPRLLAPGGLALFAQPTEENLTRHDKPSRRFLLDDGEVAELAERWAAAGLDIIDASQDWRDEESHLGWVVARNP